MAETEDSIVDLFRLEEGDRRGANSSTSSTSSDESKTKKKKKKTGKSAKNKSKSNKKRKGAARKGSGNKVDAELSEEEKKQKEKEKEICREGSKVPRINGYIVQYMYIHTCKPLSCSLGAMWFSCRWSWPWRGRSKPAMSTKQEAQSGVYLS